MTLALFRRLLARLRYRRRWALVATTARQDADRATLRRDRQVASAPRPLRPVAKRRRAF
jgi:hypothetical protein